MNAICMELTGNSVRYPFDSSPDVRAWCIGRRMFAWCATSSQHATVQLKADPALVPVLIANYSWIQPGYHMSKRHWITIALAEADTSLVATLLEDAHALVAAKLPRAERMRMLQD